jgi:cytoskeletal protein RodZ
MTRTDVMASSRPQAQGAARSNEGPSSGWRRLIVLPIMLLLAVALAAPMSAVAAETTTTNKEGLTGYEKKAEEKSGTSPSKETTTAKKEETTTAKKEETTTPKKEETTTAKKEEPASTSSSTTPSTSTAPSTEKATAGTLPFTGFDLRWTVGMGLLLVGAGVSIVTIQRRHRGGNS